METAEIALIVVAAALAACVIAFCALLFFVKRSGKSACPGDIGGEAEIISRSVEATVKMENAMLTGAVNAQTQATKDITQRFDVFMTAVDGKLDKLRDDTARNLASLSDGNVKALAEVRLSNEAALKEVRAENAKAITELRGDNAQQLEKMRATVDEKLSGTLEQRFNQSFKIVGDRLEAINRSFADLQNLQTGVNDLKSIFKNIKTRGTWGEVALESLLSQILIDGQFERQYNLSRTGNEPVDIVVKLPGKGDGEVLLPIDAKFPMADYQNLVEASENADADGVETYGKALERSVKIQAQSIRDKYIKPPKTTDFAIMYLPVEGLYAEVVKRNGLIEDLQTRCRIVVCGPTTLAALLNSLQMGFRSVAIEKRSAEIGKLLTAFVGDFDKFSNLLQKTSKSLENVQSTIASANSRTEIIRRKLDKVSKYAAVDGVVETVSDDDDLADGILTDVSGDSDD